MNAKGLLAGTYGIVRTAVSLLTVYMVIDMAQDV